MDFLEAEGCSHIPALKLQIWEFDKFSELKSQPWFSSGGPARSIHYSLLA
jgi:hypothetical protein